MNRHRDTKNKHMAVLLLTAVLIFTSTACKMPSIGRVVGNLGETLKNMFENIAGGFGF